MDTTTQRHANEDDQREAREARDAEEREAKRQEQIRRNQAAIQMLEEWMQEDPEEQRETLEYLMRVLDEDRPSYRKLFP